MAGAYLTFFVFILLVVGVIVAVGWYRRKQVQEWDALSMKIDEAEIRNTRHDSVEAALAAIRSGDDAFSSVLFEDFLYALYAEVHTHRGSRTLDRLSPYLSTTARSTLEEYPATEVFAIVVGGMRVESISTDATGVGVEVIYTSNMEEKDENGKTHAFYMEERWRLHRSGAAKSRAPEAASVIGCPSCGAPLDKMVGGTCGYCEKTPGMGEFDWFVTSIEVGSRERRGPMLTGTTEEEGTDLPTVVARDAKKRMESLRQRDAAFQWPAFVKRVEHVFHAFHHSWGAQDLKEVRPYLSDSLYNLQTYWVNAYRAQRLKNITEHPTVMTIHLANVGHDKYFDSVTVRVFASCVDYTVDQNGKVVGGDNKSPRHYSEYWTFIRGSGKTGAPRADASCPSCGGSIADINMAGTCSHCKAKVTSGEFDWVLSRIEQDEVYDRVA